MPVSTEELDVIDISTVAIASRVTFHRLVELLRPDQEFWAWHDLLCHSDFRDFRIIARNQSLDLRRFIGCNLTVEEYRKVWGQLRLFVLLGESDVTILEAVIRPYLDSLQHDDVVWHAKAWTIWMTYEKIMQIPDRDYASSLVERMSAKQGNEKFEALIGTPSDLDPNELIPVDMSLVADDPWIVISGALVLPRYILDMPIEQLGTSPRTLGCLKKSQLTKLGQLFLMRRDELLSLRNFGRPSLVDLQNHTRNVLSQHAPSVTVSIPELPPVG